MDEQRLDDQLEPIYNSSAPIQDIALKTSREQRTREMGNERGSRRSVLAVWHDDDDDDDLPFLIMYASVNLAIRVLASTKKKGKRLKLPSSNSLLFNVGGLTVFLKARVKSIWVIPSSELMEKNSLSRPEVQTDSLKFEVPTGFTLQNPGVNLIHQTLSAKG